MAKFKKGQLVNVFAGNYDTGDVSYITYTVASCGEKQMHLLRADGSNAEFRCSMRHYSIPAQGHDVQPAEVDPVAHAAELRKLNVVRLHAHYLDRVQCGKDYVAEGGVGAPHYLKSMEEKLAAFVEHNKDLI